MPCKVTYYKNTYNSLEALKPVLSRLVVRKAVEDHLMNNIEDVDNEILNQAEQLMEKLSSPAPLSPGSYFGLHYTGFFSLVNNILTYLLVLVSFKVTG